MPIRLRLCIAAVLILAVCSLSAYSAPRAVSNNTPAVRAYLPLMRGKDLLGSRGSGLAVMGTWDVAIHWPGNPGAITYTFVYSADGRLAYTAWNERGGGQWNQNGSTVTWTFDPPVESSVLFTGVLTGTLMSGTVHTASGQIGSWTAGKRGELNLPPPDQPAGPNSIVGRWLVAYQTPGNAGPIDYTYIFTADGSLSYSAWYGGGIGQWTQHGTTVEWLLNATSDQPVYFSGVVSSTLMSGNLRTPAGQTVPWTAGRIGPHAPLPPPADPSGPDSIVGQWLVAYQTPGNSGAIPYTYTFTADGRLAYSAWVGNGTGQWTQTDRAVEWIVDFDNGYQLDFTGVVSGSTMSGTVLFGDGQTAPWTAGRIGPHAPLPPPADPSGPDSIVGRWLVSFQTPGNPGAIPYTYTFTADGRLAYSVWYGDGTGQWTQTDRTVEWILDSDTGYQTDFTGVVSGTLMSGTVLFNDGQTAPWTAGRIGP